MVTALTRDDRKFLDDAYRQAVINVYGPWLTAGWVIPPGELALAVRRVRACRAELARCGGTLPFPVIVEEMLTPTGGVSGA